jgi:hypothetical protein
MNKLKQRWGIQSNLDICLILIVFSITGSTSVFVAEPVLDYVGLKKEAFTSQSWDIWLYWSVRILLVFPIYQVLLLIFGWLFGQFRFFWTLEKKMLRKLGFGFIFNRI